MATQGTKVVRRPVHGVLLLDKPVGLSSQDALYKAKRLLRAEKAGHTGTLDPLASGLLPVFLGDSTRFSSYLLDADKRYETELELYNSYKGWYSDASDDPVVQQFLLQFLELQRTSVGEYGDLLSRIQLVDGDKAGMLLIDQELGG